MSNEDLTKSRSTPLIQLSNLTKVYQEGEQERVVLANVSATIMRGEFAVLLGPSGSGKSTLLNLISGVDLPSSGDVSERWAPDSAKYATLGPGTAEVADVRVTASAVPFPFTSYCYINST